MNKLKFRKFEDCNYSAFMVSDSTIRFPFRDKEAMLPLKYPEFYDVKITNRCDGGCKYCYQDSKLTDHSIEVLRNFNKFFGALDSNQKPFQIAFGGGEPTIHSQFPDIIKSCYDMGIVPNYTTNGNFMVSDEYPYLPIEILEITKKYCGGVAVSTHPHLPWNLAAKYFVDNGIYTSLHVIISDKESIDRFFKIYEEWKGLIKYFVLLPYEVMGRAKEVEKDFSYLFDKLKGNEEDIAYGANFFKDIVERNKSHNNQIKASLYDQEMFSKYLDLTTMKIYKSSFNLEEVKIGE